MNQPNFDRNCMKCGKAIYQGVLCAECYNFSAKVRKMYKDVTQDVEIGWYDEECCQIKKCACGYKADDILTIYESQVPQKSQVWECPQCHRKLTIKQTLTVIEHIEE